MLDHIEHLRQKSEYHRKRAAFLMSSGIMLVIVGIWLVTFPTRFPELMPSAEAQATAELNSPDATNGAASPLEALREGLNGGYAAPTDVATTSTSATHVDNSNSGSEVVSNGVIITDPNLETNDQLHIVK